MRKFCNYDTRFIQQLSFIIPFPLSRMPMVRVSDASLLFGQKGSEEASGKNRALGYMSSNGGQGSGMQPLGVCWR
jgi:hypothetical protein